MSVQAPKQGTQIDPRQRPNQNWTPRDWAILAAAAVAFVAVLWLGKYLIRLVWFGLLTQFGWVAVILVLAAFGVVAWYLDQRSKRHS